MLCSALAAIAVFSCGGCGNLGLLFGSSLGVLGAYLGGRELKDIDKGLVHPSNNSTAKAAIMLGLIVSGVSSVVILAGSLSAVP